MTDEPVKLFKYIAAEGKGKGDADDVRAALAAGVDPHAPDAGGETAFNHAARVNAPVAGRLLTLHWLQQALDGKGAMGLNDLSGAHQSTLAQYMAKWLADDEIAAWLQKATAQGLIVDKPNASGWTPLIAAAAMGRIGTVSALLPYYGREALCHQTTEEYVGVYNGCAVVYRVGLNALEVAQERIFQDDGASEALGIALWECADIIAAAITASKKQA